MSKIDKKLQFVPFLSTVSPGFWYESSKRKIDIFKLDDTVQKISGFYTDTDNSNIPCRHSIEYNAFNITDGPPSLCYKSHGNFYLKNTIEEFKTIDKKQLLQNEAQQIWDDIISGKALQDPSLLVRFCLLGYIDLKKYHFHYWFGFPSFLRVTNDIRVTKSCPLGDALTASAMERLQSENECFNKAAERHDQAFRIVSFLNRNKDSPKFHKLSEFTNLLQEDVELWFVFSDPSTLPDHPGWPLRNFLLLIQMHWRQHLNNTLKVICMREKTLKGIKSISQSLYLELTLGEQEWNLASPCLEATGWERNNYNKLGPRIANMGNNMDPVRLAESAVDLNLKLMRWRLMPSINLEKLAKSKCLLLGAGTLGCNVARALLGWGVRTITLLDNSSISFSNPVRQSLFEFEDCAPGGGRSKAVAAAERLKKIFPGVDAKGIDMSVPMPGHPVNTNEKTLSKAKEDIATLTDAIENHDVVFLLMDSRESRWLPTLIASEKDKLAINAALGFDSYLVMRHGIRESEKDSACAASHPKLGCYFCNDVVAPGNSMKDRTLDQQCTVSRPGISMIAAALAVELFVAVTQHSEGGSHVPADKETEDRDESPMGMVPHQIRGYLAHYQTLLPTTFAFTKCTACSEIVLDEYRRDGIDFLMKVFNSPPQYLEDITGLTQLHLETALAEDEILEYSDNESV